MARSTINFIFLHASLTCASGISSGDDVDVMQVTSTSEHILETHDEDRGNATPLRHERAVRHALSSKTWTATELPSGNLEVRPRVESFASGSRSQHIELYGMDGKKVSIPNAHRTNVIDLLKRNRIAAVVVKNAMPKASCRRLISMLESRQLTDELEATVDNVDSMPAYSLSFWGGWRMEHAPLMKEMGSMHYRLFQRFAPKVIDPVVSLFNSSDSGYAFPRVRAFVRRFRQDERLDHPPHYDTSQLSGCYQLSDPADYTGGFFFYPWGTDETNGTRMHLPQPDQGDLILWNGYDIRHGAMMKHVRPGKSRYMLGTFWYDAEHEVLGTTNQEGAGAASLRMVKRRKHAHHRGVSARRKRARRRDRR